MQSLYCQAADCMHNQDGHCAANVIQISNANRGTFCDTYVKNDAFVAAGNDDMDTLFDSAADTEFGQESDAAPRISCNVTQCAYNTSLHCRASGVSIDAPTGEMTCHCKTYRSK